jgi:CelD/BcsL family acetyltransferase involved in cellulose biosynthesis
VEQAARRTAEVAGLSAPQRVGPPAGPEVLDPARGYPAAFVAEWRALAARLEHASYFQTPDWVLGWWETIGRRPATHLAAWRDGSGRLLGVVALSRGREQLHRRLPAAVPLWVNSGSGAGTADHCGWLVPPALAGAAQEWLEDAIDGSALLVRNADGDWPGRLVLPAGARVVATTACPQLALPLVEGGRRPSGSFVRQLRRFARRLGKAGVEFEWVPPGDLGETLVVRLIELHAGRRAQRGGGTFGMDQLGLHRRLIDSGDSDGGPAALVARRGDAIVGVLYGFWWRRSFAAYQSGWDEAYARDGLGNVMILRALECVSELGATRFDFLRGSEPYKYRFGASDRRDRTWLVANGWAGRLLDTRFRASALKRSLRPVPSGGPPTRRTDRQAGASLGTG